MPLKPAITRKFVHDALKPIDSVVQFLQILNINPEFGHNKQETLKTFIKALDHLRKSLTDIRLLAACEDPGEHKWKTMELRKLVLEHADILKKKASFEREVSGAPIAVRGDEGLLTSALDNIAYVCEHFDNHLSKIVLTETLVNGKPTARIVYEIETAEEVGPELGACTPFFPLSKKSLALDSNTGFILDAIKAIMELHHGKLECAVAGKKASLELTLPLIHGQRDD